MLCKLFLDISKKNSMRIRKKFKQICKESQEFTNQKPTFSVLCENFPKISPQNFFFTKLKQIFIKLMELHDKLEEFSKKT